MNSYGKIFIYTFNYFDGQNKACMVTNNLDLISGTYMIKK